MEIDNFEEALFTVDNRYNEWFESRTPLGQFVVLLCNLLRIGYGFPLTPDTKRHSAAFYAIAEECHIRRELATEREQLSNQKQAMQELETEFGRLVRTNEERMRKWQAQLDSESSDECNLPFREYYEDMIQYTRDSSKRLVQAMKKVSSTAIDSEESMVFNDLERHSSLVCYMQNRNHLRAELESAKKQRLEVERIRKEILSTMDFLGRSDPLEAVHVGSRPQHQSQKDAE